MWTGLSLWMMEKSGFDGTPKEVFSHYKELEKLGLAAPQVTYVTHALKEKGWDIDTVPRLWKKRRKRSQKP